MPFGPFSPLACFRYLAWALVFIIIPGHHVDLPPPPARVCICQSLPIHLTRGILDPYTYLNAAAQHACYISRMRILAICNADVSTYSL